MTWAYDVTIKGSVPSMKNGRIRASWGGVIRSKQAREWEEGAGWQLPKMKEPYTGKVALLGVFYYRNSRSDLDENTLMDALQKFGVLADDNQVKAKATFWEQDTKDPRVEFALVPYEEWKSPGLGAVAQVLTKLNIARLDYYCKTKGGEAG